jgi:protein-tyrosine phosphatase
VLIHCVGGRDRTALVSAFLLDLVGVPRPTIGDDYALSAECLRSQDEDYVENGPGDRAERERMVERFQTRPEVIIETLTWIDETFWGVRGYLHNAGVSDGDLALIRKRLVD